MSDLVPARVNIASHQEANQEGEFHFVGERVGRRIRGLENQPIARQRPLHAAQMQARHQGEPC